MISYEVFGNPSRAVKLSPWMRWEIDSRNAEGDKFYIGLSC